MLPLHSRGPSEEAGRAARVRKSGKSRGHAALPAATTRAAGHPGVFHSSSGRTRGREGLTLVLLSYTWINFCSSTSPGWVWRNAPTLPHRLRDRCRASNATINRSCPDAFEKYTWVPKRINKLLCTENITTRVLLLYSFAFLVLGLDSLSSNFQILPMQESIQRVTYICRTTETLMKQYFLLRASFSSCSRVLCNKPGTNQGGECWEQTSAASSVPAASRKVSHLSQDKRSRHSMYDSRC